MRLELLRPYRTFATWLAVVAAIYLIGTLAVSTQVVLRPDHGTSSAAAPQSAPSGPPLPAVPVQIARNMLHGDVALDQRPGGTDTVTRNGRSYEAISLGPILPFLPFAPFPALDGVAQWAIGLVLGVGAAALCWPLAASYGPGGPATVWLATLGALGTLLLPLSVMGNYYYIAQEEAMLATIVVLLEFNARRRPWVIGLAFGLAALARPTVAIAVVPVGLAVVLGSDRRVRSAIGLAIPLVAVAGVIGWYDWARFGSPFDTGYATSRLPNQVLIRWRHQGLFSIHHVRTNLKTLVAGGFSISRSFPFVIPNPYGHSVLLTSPALLLAVRAGFRNRTAAVLWTSAALITIALLLYYGGAGYQTYGYRYFLDAVPFLLALVAMAARRHFGRLERTLIVLSVVFCAYGAFWGAYNGHF